MSELLLGIDVGTFSSEAALVTAAGEVLRTAVAPHGIATPLRGPSSKTLMASGSTTSAFYAGSCSTARPIVAATWPL